jgi:hypothetical protein
MAPALTWTSGIFVGLNVFLAMAVTGVVAVNGASYPGLEPERSAAAGATAESQFPEKQPGSLQALDLNGDGRLSLAEAAGHADIMARFQRADRNKDGKLSQVEFDRLDKLPEKPPPRKKPRSKKAAQPKT